ncbi:MAG: DUF427 domain-containing protein [Actinomycetota bacterium]|nr:DUF427 domain-containing protein [Actinomycetota bacterium]
MSDRGRVRVEASSKRVRAILGGEVVVDTTAPLLVWEVPYYPTYYFPEADVRTDLLVETGETRRSPSRGDATQYVVKAGSSEGAAYAYHEPKLPELDGYYSFVWKTLDHWFEEDEEVFVHARDPYTRVDILPSGRRVRVEIDGMTVADTTNGSFLYETNLPTRYYMPKTDVRMDLLSPTDLATACPYKGTARYWNVSVDGSTHENVVWGYDAPLPESQKIAGLVAFYNEKVDIFIDEVLQDRPKTKFS